MIHDFFDSMESFRAVSAMGSLPVRTAIPGHRTAIAPIPRDPLYQDAWHERSFQSTSRRFYPIPIEPPDTAV